MEPDGMPYCMGPQLLFDMAMLPFAAPDNSALIEAEESFSGSTLSKAKPARLTEGATPTPPSPLRAAAMTPATLVPCDVSLSGGVGLPLFVA
ncbi:hypothetical protein WJ96_20310 [Burkholderia ubonensis]|uniref:Uncharacterized protein n=1 Tax=Burkholderia ubonensis TaxID=101571 RepID=A0AAW3MME3_9BURK|nr:hypothetical protein WJ45_16055 [Burkholderia ubonensis]KVN83156.1 hypothetical protein WJ67_04650 [Burkholderia ubonensis]KVO39557.1 hypothetical protein WJ75_08615 [Burkholderia ubonensis]KVP89342.1 hypothetical protein WJ96_20310 [Burkholderia ubonensis]KVQ54185.1 hypothetical protein WK04_02805 [Burkholderia ubonensis]